MVRYREDRWLREGTPSGAPQAGRFARLTSSPCLRVLNKNRRGVHAGSGFFFVDGSQLQARAGDIVVAPAGTAHRFVNSGSDRLQLTAIHHNANFATEWLEPLTPEQRYWSSQHR